MSGLNTNITGAINRFEDDLSEMSFADRYDQLSQEILSIRFTNIRKMISAGKAITKEQGELVKAIQNEFDEIDKVYNKLKKSGRLGDINPNEKFGEQLLSIIQNKKSTIGEIVRVIPINTPKE